MTARSADMMNSSFGAFVIWILKPRQVLELPEQLWHLLKPSRTEDPQDQLDALTELQSAIQSKPKELCMHAT